RSWRREPRCARPCPRAGRRRQAASRHSSRTSLVDITKERVKIGYAECSPRPIGLDARRAVFEITSLIGCIDDTEQGAPDGGADGESGHSARPTNQQFVGLAVIDGIDCVGEGAAGWLVDTSGVPLSHVTLGGRTEILEGSLND